MLFIFALILLVFPVWAFDAQSNSNVAVYWGQNSGGSQQRLSYYCDSDAADIFIISFMHVFPNPVQLNFANACEGTYTSSGILQCSTIAEDIKTCQSKGKKILLSLGGAAGSYGFSDDSTATEFATTLWQLFGNSDALATSERPFYDAVLDGFDFDIENNNPTGYAALADELRTIFATDTSKSYYLGAAPQCPYPDASVGDLLQKSDIDFVFIQFYNNYCNLGGSYFNWDTWLDYAENVSPNKNVKLFVGVPASSAAAGSGYNSPSVIASSLTSDILNSRYFGGISMWDVSAGWTNTNGDENFVESMKSIVAGASPVDTTSYSSTTTTTTTSTTTTTHSSTTPTTTSITPITTSTTSSSTSPTPSTTSTTPSSTTSSSSSTISGSSSSSSSSVTPSSTTSSTSTTSSSVAPTTTSSSTSTTSSSSSTTSTSSPVETTSASSTAVPVVSSSSSTTSSTSSAAVPTTSSSAAVPTTSSTSSAVPTTSSTSSQAAVPTTSSTTSTTASTSNNREVVLSTTSADLVPPTVTVLSRTTSTRVSTYYVWAPTTLVTLTTEYQIHTTRTHLHTVYGEPQTVTVEY
ncbi:Chitinase 3 [Candida viswanathii]|uniref:chitinase n=1 Tax=Candida viswanathii TaxID=5486 RepID=A0A367YJJ8_9ASCO|nr:Chitinase 3 [Candida viswanathii]